MLISIPLLVRLRAVGKITKKNSLSGYYGYENHHLPGGFKSISNDTILPGLRLICLSYWVSMCQRTLLPPNMTSLPL